MTETEIHNLLVVGIDATPIADAARKAGYRIYAADYFGDTDLRRICSDSKAIIEQKKGKSCGKIESRFRAEDFLKNTRSLLQRHQIDGILLSSGLDDYPDVLSRLHNLVPILGNSPEVIRRVRKKQDFYKELTHLEISHPETALVDSLDEARAAAEEIGYPVVVKPIKGFGGAGIRTAQNSDEIVKAFSEAALHGDGLIVQRLIDGIHASISLLIADKNIRMLTLNEQLLGLPSLFQREPFGYCGNIVPLNSAESVLEKCRLVVGKIAVHFGLKGSIGVDLLISKRGTLHVIEVNPRFQGTLECVNRVLGMNIVKLHVDACLNGSLPTIERKTSTFCTRLILYAPRRVTAPDLTVFPQVRDKSLPGTIIEKGEPLCSIITEEKSRELSLRKAKNLVGSIYGRLCPA